jgi:hypothetical protein
MSTNVCPNCRAQITCGCQKRVLADGRQGCTNCINQLKQQETQSQPPQTT